MVFKTISLNFAPVIGIWNRRETFMGRVSIFLKFHELADLGLFTYLNTLHNHGTIQEISTALKTFRILREIILFSDIYHEWFFPLIIISWKQLLASFSVIRLCQHGQSTCFLPLPQWLQGILNFTSSRFMAHSAKAAGKVFAHTCTGFRMKTQLIILCSTTMSYMFLWLLVFTSKDESAFCRQGVEIK